MKRLALQIGCSPPQGIGHGVQGGPPRPGWPTIDPLRIFHRRGILASLQARAAWGQSRVSLCRIARLGCGPLTLWGAPGPRWSPARRSGSAWGAPGPRWPLREGTGRRQEWAQVHSRKSPMEANSTARNSRASGRPPHPGSICAVFDGVAVRKLANQAGISAPRFIVEFRDPPQSQRAQPTTPRRICLRGAEPHARACS